MSNPEFREGAKAFLRYRRAEQKREDSRFSWCEPKPDRRVEYCLSFSAEANAASAHRSKKTSASWVFHK